MSRLLTLRDYVVVKVNQIINHSGSLSLVDFMIVLQISMKDNMRRL